MIKTIFIFIAFIVFFTGCNQEKNIQKSSKIVKIGVIAPLSGKDKELGYQSLHGIQAAQKMQRYLNNGDEIVFEIVDTKSDLNSSKEAILSLLKKDIKAIISFMPSDSTVYTKELINKSKIPLVATIASDNLITSENGYISQVCMDNKNKIIVAAHFIRDEKLIENIGVVYDGDSYYSSSLATEFRDYMLTLEGNIDFFIDVSSADGIFKLENLKQNDTKMVFNVSNYLHSSKILDIFKKKNLKFKVVSTDGILSSAKKIIPKKIDLFEGLYLVEHYAEDVKKTPNKKRLESILKKDLNKDNSYAFLAYDGYQLLKYALNNCTDYDAKCINYIMKNSDTVDGSAGNFSMINSKVQRKIYVDVVKNSKLYKEVVIF